MDFVKLKDYLRVQIQALKALAALTNQAWDDEYAARLEAIFEGLFGPSVYGATCASACSGGDPVHAALLSADARALPAWLIPLLEILLRRLLAG